MFNWLVYNVDRWYSFLVYLEGPNAIRLLQIGGLAPGTIINLYNQVCVGLSIVEADTRVFIASFDANGAGLDRPKIVNAFLSGAPVDTAFPDPMTATPTIAESASGLGSISAGEHLFTYRLETRSGFPGKPSSAVVAFTVSPGGRYVTFDMTVAIPGDGAVIHVLATTQDDHATFYDIPFARISVAAGNPAWHVVIPVDFADEALVAASASADATARFSYLTGSGAPRPSKIFRYGNRTCYIAGKKCYISDPYSAQTLSEDQHAVQVEGQIDIVTGESIRTSVALFCANSTHVLGGNNNKVPREWAPPVRVSDAIGAGGPNCVKPSTGAEFLWVAHESGLNIFNGAYGEIPVSVMFESDWKRINWAAGETIQMEDSQTERVLYILVPLDGATRPNYRMVIDYQRARSQGGVDPEQIDYVLDDYKVGGVVTAVPSIAFVQDYDTKKRQLWMGLDGGVAIKQDLTARNDNGQILNALYETGLVLAPSQARNLMSKFGGIAADVKGSGTLLVSPYGMNRRVTPDDGAEPITLEDEPNGMAESKWHMDNENQSIRMEVNELNDWFELSGLTVYHKPSGTSKS